MLNGNNKVDIGVNLKNAFDSGYSNAATSFSILAKTNIVFSNLRNGFHKIDEDFNAQDFLTRKSPNVLLTTEIFGDITGKSYLLFSPEEYSLLTKDVPESKDPKLNLKEEFAKEVDNILSASVITKLSNALNRKMYGDIPIMVGVVNARVVDIIFDDFNEQASEVYVNASYFSIGSYPWAKPLFIWVVDSTTLAVHEANRAY